MMQAAKAHPNHNGSGPNKASALRNQLLSTDIGNIDVRHEIPVNQQQMKPQVQQYVQPGPSQQHYFQQHPQPHHQSQPFYPPQPRTADQQSNNGSYSNNQYGNPQQQYRQPMIRPPQPDIIHSSSSRSRRTSMTSNSSFSFLKMGKGRKGNGGGGDGFDDGDDDGKDYDMDPTSQVMSFDDLSMLKDRGRYGGNGQSTYDSAPIIPTLASPSSRPSGKASNTQYRKQMFAIKKQAMSRAGQALNNGPGPDPRAMSLQTMRNPYHSQTDSRQGSFNSQTPPYAKQSGPRANSLTSVPQQQIPNGARAYSLTTNPYQAQQMTQRRGPPLQPPMQQRVYQPQLPTGKRLSIPNVSSPLSNGAHPQSQQPMPHGPPVQRPQQRQVPQSALLQMTQQVPKEQIVQQANPSEHIHQPPLGIYPEVREKDHHFLADNTIGDDSATSHEDSKEHSGTFPKEESTPSPERHGSSLPAVDSPSKLPRSKALPRLSLLNMRDDEDGFADVRGSNEYVQRTLAPVNEQTRVDTFKNDSPSKLVPQRSAGNSGTHSKGMSLSSMSDFSTTSDYSPDKRTGNIMYQLAEPSNATDVFVTASQFSLMDNNTHMSNISQPNGQTLKNENASIGTLTPATPRFNDHPLDRFETKSSKRDSTSSFGSSQSRETRNSITGALKSPKFFKNWSKKRKERKNNEIFEPVTKPLELDPQPRTTQKTQEKDCLRDDDTKQLRDEIQVQPLNIVPREPVLKSIPIVESVNGHDTPQSKRSLNADLTLGSSLGDDLDTSANHSKKLELTVEQLGIMQESTSLIRELNLVSSELAASVKREIILEEKLDGSDSVSSPQIQKDRDYASTIAQLIQELNNERQKRFIAEEHVLLMENGSKPSLIELSYENEKLRSQISMNEELISMQSSEIDSLKRETPELKLQVASLSKLNKEMETVTIPNLKNKIEILSNDNKKVMILSEKLKILRNEKLQLENGPTSSDVENFSFVKKESPLKESGDGSFSREDDSHLGYVKQRTVKASPMRPSLAFRNVHRPPSFSLINVTTTGND